MLLSLGAGGVGLNLVGANHLFLVDCHWNPQVRNLYLSTSEKKLKMSKVQQKLFLLPYFDLSSWRRRPVTGYTELGRKERSLFTGEHVLYSEQMKLKLCATAIKLYDMLVNMA